MCRAAGYYQHALFVSQAAAETEWYLDILLEDMQSWDDALAYLQVLSRQQAAAALKKHGKVCSTDSSACLSSTAGLLAWQSDYSVFRLLARVDLP